MPVGTAVVVSPHLTDQVVAVNNVRMSVVGRLSDDFIVSVYGVSARIGCSPDPHLVAIQIANIDHRS